MKNWTPALLPLLLLSCADNELQPPGPTTPSLQSAAVPARVVAGWSTPLELRVEADLPEGEEGLYTVLVDVQGPGLPESVVWTLADDGSAGVLVEPGPGQLERSGDNVPGDGAFTARFDADFSAETGDFTLGFRLMRGAEQQDSRSAAFARALNAAPTLIELAAPDTLASGATLLMEVIATDPDGAEDLVGVQLETTGGAMRSWSFEPAADDHWTLSVGPEIAAGQQGPTGFAVVAVDRAGQSATQDLSIVLENEPPVLDEEALQFYLQLEDESLQPIETGDTIHLYVPSFSPADVNVYGMFLPIADPQTSADIQVASWRITAIDDPLVTTSRAMTDDDGDGVYVGGISLNGDPDGYDHHVYFLLFEAEDAFATSTHQRFIRIHDFGDVAPAPPGDRLGGSLFDGTRPSGPMPAAGGFAR